MCYAQTGRLRLELRRPRMGGAQPTARLQRLLDLGFSVAECRAALEAAEDDVAKAEAMLLQTLSEIAAKEARNRAEGLRRRREASCSTVSRVSVESLLEPLEPEATGGGGEGGGTRVADNRFSVETQPKPEPAIWEITPELEDVDATEIEYVAELNALCKIMEALRLEGVLGREDEAAIFANVDALRAVNTQLLAELHRKPSTGERDPLTTLAAAFEAAAPYLRAYSTFCASFVTSQKALSRVRAAKGAPFEARLREAEAEVGQPLSSLLIKPVQRLTKYPLLFKELERAVPPSHRAAVALRRAARAVEGVVAEVNEKVRHAEGQARLVELAETLGDAKLVTPQRELLSSVELSAQALEGGGGGGGERRQHILWLCSDMLALGRRSGKGKAASLSLSMQAPLAACSLEVAGGGEAGDACLRLSSSECHEGGAQAFVLRPPSQAAADALLAAFAEAKASEASALEGHEDPRRQE